MAGAALGAHQLHFAWQVQHVEHLERSAEVWRRPGTLGHRLLLRGRRNTWSMSVSLCVVLAMLHAPVTVARILSVSTFRDCSRFVLFCPRGTVCSAQAHRSLPIAQFGIHTNRFAKHRFRGRYIDE